MIYKLKNNRQDDNDESCSLPNHGTYRFEILRNIKNKKKIVTIIIKEIFSNEYTNCTTAEGIKLLNFSAQTKELNKRIVESINVV